MYLIQLCTVFVLIKKTKHVALTHFTLKCRDFPEIALELP